MYQAEWLGVSSQTGGASICKRVSGGVVSVARLLLDRSPLRLIFISDYFPEYFSDYFPEYFCLSQVLDQNLQFPTSRAIRHLADLVWSNDQKQRRKLRRGTVGRIIKERRHEIENRAELVLCGL